MSAQVDILHNLWCCQPCIIVQVARIALIPVRSARKEDVLANGIPVSLYSFSDLVCLFYILQIVRVYRSENKSRDNCWGGDVPSLLLWG